jgi:hypothetical protein
VREDCISEAVGLELSAVGADGLASAYDDPRNAPPLEGKQRRHKVCWLPRELIRGRDARRDTARGQRKRLHWYTQDVVRAGSKRAGHAGARRRWRVAAIWGG